MNILVTGGAGMIGSNLCRRLLKEGHKVVCIDNFLVSDGSNVSDLEKGNKFKLVRQDVLDPFPKLPKLDRIYHLASPASPLGPKSMHVLAFETMAVNTQGTWKMCQLALENKARLLFASTSEVYGDPQVYPQVETYLGNVSTIGPRSVYDEAKRFGETIVAAFVRSKGLDGKIIRIFNTYGPGMAIDDGRMLIQFVKAALNDEDIEIFGDGSQTRSMCFISDQIEGMIRLMESESTKGLPVNIGNPTEMSILEIAELVKKKIGSKSKFVYRPLPQDDPLRRCPDISLAGELLDWTPKINFDKGLGLFIDYVSDKLKSENG